MESLIRGVKADFYSGLETWATSGIEMSLLLQLISVSIGFVSQHVEYISIDPLLSPQNFTSEWLSI